MEMLSFRSGFPFALQTAQAVCQSVDAFRFVSWVGYDGTNSAAAARGEERSTDGICLILED